MMMMGHDDGFRNNMLVGDQRGWGNDAEEIGLGSERKWWFRCETFFQRKSIFGIYKSFSLKMMWPVWKETVGQPLICSESCTLQHRHNWRGVRTYLWRALFFEHLWERGLFWRAFLVISNIFLWFSTMHFSDPLTYILLERELLWSGSVEIALAEGSRYYRCSTLWTTPCCSAALSNPDIQLAC